MVSNPKLPKGTTVFECFDAHARKVVVSAQEEARRLNHAYIGAEHLLLALTRGAESGNAAGAVLNGLGVNHKRALKQVRTIVGEGQEPALHGHIPFMADARNVLELSMRVAKALGHNYTGTEHLLLGLMSRGDDTVSAVLSKYKVSSDEIRTQVLLGLGIDPDAVYW